MVPFKCSKPDHDESEIRLIPHGPVRERAIEMLVQLSSHEELRDHGLSRIGVVVCRKARYVMVSSPVEHLCLHAIRLPRVGKLAGRVAPQFYALAAEGDRVVLVDIDETERLLKKTGKLALQRDVVLDTAIMPTSDRATLNTKTS